MGLATGETRFLEPLFAQQARDGRTVVEVELVEFIE
jgi:hypothetical protein